MEIRTVPSFLDYWRNIRARTRRVAERIPEDRLEWVPAPGRFTPGDLVRHLAAIERHMYAESVHGRPSAYHGCGAELAAGRDAVLAYMDRLHAESLELFAQLSDADLQRKCLTAAGTPITTWKWLRAMVEHESHHRGQIYLLLGMLGIDTPPLFGLTAQEVVARSARPGVDVPLPG
ncbi:MAG: DinB family protein [Gemmatimonadaceae bacterium]